MTATEPVVLCDESLELISGVFCAVTDGGDLTLATTGRSAVFGPASAWKRAVLDRLTTQRCRVADFGVLTDDADGLEAFVGALRMGGWLTATASHRDRLLYSVRPTHRPPEGSRAIPDALVLSRFTVLRREDDQLVAESPLGWAEVWVHDPGVAAFLSTLTTADAAAAATLPAEVVQRVLADLWWAGLAVPVHGDEETELRLRQWQPHELWFHRRTRMTGDSRFGGKYGRTQWAKGRFDPPPARDTPYPGPLVELYRPDLDALRRTDSPLAAVVEDRRSTRQHDDDNPITAEQLGELLYRCARVRGTFHVDGLEYARRPYPSGGSVYELELYPVVRLASGLEPGMYHYDAHDHALRLVSPPNAAVARLIRTAAHSTLVGATPQVLLLVTARFGRLMWTYEQMPYSLVLKHVGVLYQTMYLAATAMGLAACGLGGGESTAFNEITGRDYASESGVGEFLLGSPGVERPFGQS